MFQKRGLTQIERAQIEVMKLMEYVESKENPLTQVLGTRQHRTNSTLLETLNNFKKHVRNEANKNIIAQNIKKLLEKMMHGQLSLKHRGKIGG
jgi:D-mannonate dehydratase